MLQFSVMTLQCKKLTLSSFSISPTNIWQIEYSSKGLSIINVDSEEEEGSVGGWRGHKSPLESIWGSHGGSGLIDIEFCSPKFKLLTKLIWIFAFLPSVFKTRTRVKNGLDQIINCSDSFWFSNKNQQLSTTGILIKRCHSALLWYVCT